MENTKREFEQFLKREVNHFCGVYDPVKAGFFVQAFREKAAPAELHPYPNDEFCLSKIGPNYEIIAGYKKEFRKLDGDLSSAVFLDSSLKEQLMDAVENLKTHEQTGAQ